MGDTAFEAISYVWGSDKKDKSIQCDGRTIAITTSLWTVLRCVRSNIPRVLWADSICINQKDKQEKARQVAMMGDIYRMAARVLVFIGAEDAGHAVQVCSLLKETSILIENGLEAAGTTQNAFPWLDDDAPLLQDTRWDSFNNLVEQSWFERGWVRTPFN